MRFSLETQFKIFDRQFFKGIYTMKQVSVKTGFDRANICRFVDKKRDLKSIYLVRKGICPITKRPAVGFYTTYYDLYLQFKTSHNGK